MTAVPGLRARVRDVVNRAVTRLRANGPSLVFAAIAAGLSYYVAGFLFVGGQPFFAPIAAIVCVGLAAGQRVRRAVEIVVGVVLGILTADVVVLAVGSGPWQLAVAVMIASGAAVALLGPRNLLSNQAAIAAVLVVALMPVSPNPFGPFGRLLEALVGGSIALGMTVVFARDPLGAVRRVGSAIVARLDETVKEIVDALDEGDLTRAERALELGSDVARLAQDFDAEVSAARETMRLARHRRRHRERLRPLQLVRSRLDILVSTMRGLARAAANSVRYGHEVPPGVITALEHLRVSLRDLDRVMRGDADPADAQQEALIAATVASAVLDQPHHLTASVMVGHIRSAAVDVLRATGVVQEEAIRRLEDAAGRADRSA